MTLKEKLQNPRIHHCNQCNHDQWQQQEVPIAQLITNVCILQVKKYQIKPWHIGEHNIIHATFRWML